MKVLRAITGKSEHTIKSEAGQRFYARNVTASDFPLLPSQGSPINLSSGLIRNPYHRELNHKNAKEISTATYKQAQITPLSGVVVAFCFCFFALLVSGSR